MLRQSLFTFSLIQMIQIGGLVTLLLLRLAFFIFLLPSLKDYFDKEFPGTSTTDWGGKITEEWIYFVFHMIRCLIWLAANLCLLFATKDDSETIVKRKMVLLNVFRFFMIVKICTDFIGSLCNLETERSVPHWDNISGSQWLEHFGTVFVYFWGYSYQIKLGVGANVATNLL